MKISNLYSPNFEFKIKRPNSSIKLIIIHYTGMQSQRESINRLCNPKSKVSSHYLVGQNGRVYRLVNDNRIAWHAGVSCWGKFKNVNKCSIGIELVNKGHKLGYENFKKKQLLSLKKICNQLRNKYKIKKQNIIGHSDVAPLRKADPGEKFPWKKFSNDGIGIWHFHRSNFLKKYRKKKILKKKDVIKFVRNLKKIGYCLTNNRKSLLNKTVVAFQRHYRQELINGVMDKECLIISQNLAKKLKNS